MATGMLHRMRMFGLGLALLALASPVGAQIPLSTYAAVTAVASDGYQPSSANTQVIERAIVWCIGDRPALDLAYAPVPVAATPAITIRQLTVLDGGLIGLPRCTVGLRLRDAWYFDVELYTYWGSGSDFGTALEVRGRSNGGSVRRMVVNNTRIGIGIYDQSEGAVIDHLQAVNVDTGVLVQTDANRPLAMVINSHINATRRGIVFRSHPQSFVSGALIYRYGQSPDFVGIEVGPGSFFTQLTATTIHCGARTAGTRGIVFDPTATQSTQSQSIIVACGTPIQTVRLVAK